MIALLASTVFPLVRTLAYEAFLWTHRIFSLTAVIALWNHISGEAPFSKTLLSVALCTLLASTTIRSVQQVFRNIGFRASRPHLAQLEEIVESEGTLVLRLHLFRSCYVQPGEYIYLTVLTSQFASWLQRHPFSVAWWETLDGEAHPRLLYVVVRPQRGWTRVLAGLRTACKNDPGVSGSANEPARAVVDRKSALVCPQPIWIDGPFGVAPDLVHYNTFVLFAGGDGIFAQLPLVKFLTDKAKTAAGDVHRVLLIWGADGPHSMLKGWIESILRDREVRKDVSSTTSFACTEYFLLTSDQVLEVHVYFPRQTYDEMPPEDKSGKGRVKVHPRDTIDVPRFFEADEHAELWKGPSRRIAIAGERLRPDDRFLCSRLTKE